MNKKIMTAMNLFNKDFFVCLLLSFLSGILNCLAFPDHDIWYLTFICWVPLLIVLRDQSPKKALFFGTFTGFIFNAFGSYWLYTTINYFGNFPALLSLFFMCILCIYQGARIGLLSWLVSRSVNKGWSFEVSFILAFMASEFLYPVLFPWHNATHVHTVPLLMQLSDIGGPILIGAFLANINLAIAEFFWASKEKRQIRKPMVISGIVTLLIMVGYGQYRISFFDQLVGTLPVGKIGIVQGNRKMIKDDAYDALRNFRKASARLEKKSESSGKLDFIIWPEGAVPFGLKEKEVLTFFNKFIFNGSTFFGNFGINTPIVTGGFIIRGAGQDKKDFNVSFLVEPNGVMGGIYEKYFLIPFGEYIPLGNIFPFLYTLSPNTLKLTPGSGTGAFSLKNHTITPLICYEDIKQGFANKAVFESDPDLIVSFANDGWFGESTVPNIHFALSKFRAVEHRRYLVRATNTGISGFVDPVGRTFETTDPVVAEEKIGEIHYMKMRTFYELIGDYPFWLLSMAIILMGFIKKNKKQLTMDI